MSDWACKKCGAINLEGQRMCEACGRAPTAKQLARSAVREGYQLMHAPDGPPPCTAEQNKAAFRILQDVLERRCDATAGRQRLADLFQMPELVNG